MTKEEAIKIIRDWNLGHAAIEVLSTFIPELKENEDERMIKFISNELACLRATDEKGSDRYEELTNAIAWLEKQGEQDEECKEINLVEILKHYPKETELFSPLYGKLWLAEVDEKNEIITCYKHHLEKGCTRAVLEQEDSVSFYSNGTTGLPDFSISKDCMLFLYDKEKQGEQKLACQLNNLYDNVKFPFKARVKSSGAIITIHGGQLSMDCKEWIKYQSDVEDGYRVYKPDELELVCEVKHKPVLEEAFNQSRKDYSLEERKEASDYSESIIPTSIAYGESKEEYMLHKIIEAAFIAGQNTKQKSTWSEEDEQMLQKALSTIRYALSIPIDKEDDPCFVGSSTISWLKSLKERMQLV